MSIILSEATDILKAAKNIVITAHINPDGDAVGSSLGLMHTLRGLGKKARVVIDDKIPSIYAVLPGYEEIERFSDDFSADEADLLVILDTAADRIGKVAEKVNAPILNIDHHVSNKGEVGRLYLDAKRAATAEIIYELVKDLNAPFTYESATSIYTGIADDTGFFRYANTTPFTMRAAAELLEYGVKPNVVSEAVETKSFDTVKGMAAALSTVEIFREGKIAGLFLNLPLVKTLETTEGFIDMVRVIEGVDVAVLVKCQEENFCRVSMRSKTLDVAKVAVKFGGGGHIRAAGCSLKMSFEEAKRSVLAALNAAFDEQEK